MSQSAVLTLSILSFYHPIFIVAIIFPVFALSALLATVLPSYKRELGAGSLQRFSSIDGLRGILCFAVLVHHAAVTYEYLPGGKWASLPSNLYNLLGHFSVALFFCITAFLFWPRVIDQGNSFPAWRFLRGRLFRILPLYVFGCLAVILIFCREIDWFSTATLRGLGKMALMGLRPWESLGAIDVGQANAGVTWSLQFEWAFYLLLPALAVIPKSGHPHRLWLVILGLLVMFGLKGQYLFFLPGIFAAHLVRRERVAKVLKAPAVALAVVATLVTIPFLTGDGLGPIALVAATLIFVPISCGNTLLGILTLPGFRLMGTISYSVYLLHGIALYLSQPFLRTTAEYARSNGSYIYWTAISLIACTVLSICVCTYRLIEVPFINFEKSLRRS